MIISKLFNIVLQKQINDDVLLSPLFGQKKNKFHLERSDQHLVYGSSLQDNEILRKKEIKSSKHTTDFKVN